MKLTCVLTLWHNICYFILLFEINLFCQELLLSLKWRSQFIFPRCCVSLDSVRDLDLGAVYLLIRSEIWTWFYTFHISPKICSVKRIFFLISSVLKLRVMFLIWHPKNQRSYYQYVIKTNLHNLEYTYNLILF